MAEILTLREPSPSSPLNRIIEDNNSLTTLPLAVNYRWATASKMIQSGVIKISECDVFGESLNYAFYGHPAFKPDEPDNNTRNSLFYPICFIIDTAKFSVANVFPFDTGAFKRDMYKAHHIPADYSIDELGLCPNITKVKGYIQMVYQSNEDYLLYRPHIVEDTEKYPGVFNAILSLVNEKGTEAIDSRARTIEFISREDILIDEAVIAIICPRSFVEAYDVKKSIKALRRKGISIVYYFEGGVSLTEFIGMIRNEAYKYYQKRGYIKRVGGD